MNFKRNNLFLANTIFAIVIFFATMAFGETLDLKLSIKSGDAYVRGPGDDPLKENYLIFLNGFLLDPRDGELAIFLDRRENDILLCPTEKGARKSEPDTFEFLATLNNKILLCQKYDSTEADNLISISFEYDSTHKIVWHQAESIEHLSSSEIHQIKVIVDGILDAYVNDDLVKLEKFEKKMIKLKNAVNIVRGRDPDDVSFKMPFYKAVFHGESRKSIQVAKDYVVELNKHNRRVVNVFNKDGSPILTLTSKLAGWNQDKFVQKTYSYNLIKIRGKWYIF